MGADYPGQERAIEEIRNLSEEAKKFLEHHICNSLNAVIGGLQVGKYEMAEDAAWHILADLELAGIRETKGRDQQKKHKPEELGKRALSETED